MHSICTYITLTKWWTFMRGRVLSDRFKQTIYKGSSKTDLFRAMNIKWMWYSIMKRKKIILTMYHLLHREGKRKGGMEGRRWEGKKEGKREDLQIFYDKVKEWDWGWEVSENWSWQFIPFTSSVSLGASFHFTEHQFIPLKTGIPILQEMEWFTYKKSFGNHILT